MTGVCVESLACCNGLVRRTGVNVLGRGGVKLRMRLVEEDRGSMGHHMGLEHHLIQAAVAIEGIALGSGEVKAPICEEGFNFCEIFVLGGKNWGSAHKLSKITRADDAIGK